MKVGILYEGIYDKKSLIEILTKLISNKRDLTPGQISFILYSPDGDIEGSIKTAAILFFDTNYCDIGVFVADCKKNKAKERRIRGNVTRHCKDINPDANFVCGFPDPELEQWFLNEENAIRKILKLNKERGLPYRELKPKERLLKIIEENRSQENITESNLDIYAQIASALDLEKLSSCNPSFKKFKNALVDAV